MAIWKVVTSILLNPESKWEYANLAVKLEIWLTARIKNFLGTGRNQIIVRMLIIGVRRMDAIYAVPQIGTCLNWVNKLTLLSSNDSCTLCFLKRSTVCTPLWNVPSLIVIRFNPFPCTPDRPNLLTDNKHAPPRHQSVSSPQRWRLTCLSLLNTPQTTCNEVGNEVSA